VAVYAGAVRNGRAGDYGPAPAVILVVVGLAVAMSRVLEERDITASLTATLVVSVSEARPSE
jgi:hypothetical protein